MGAAKKLIDKKVLRDLVPVNALSAVHLEEISKKAVITDVRAGRYVFKKGDRDYQSIYLLDGKIELLGDMREVVGEIHAGSEAARHPLAHKQPRQLSARAVGNVTIACIDSSLLDVLLTWDESSGYDVVEIDAQQDDDWMTRMLQSQAFLQLPPSNIHQLLMRLETIETSAGDVIVRQGDDGDYFYIVKSGRLSVTRKASSRSKEVALAELGEGACFGEEALVSGTKRNASVTMLTDGCLMRLAQADFNELLCTPLVHEIDFPEAQKLIAEGALWLDVRLPGELENHAIKGAINLPLSALRDQASELNDDVAYIVCCDTGRRSAAGAFVLSQNGFTVYTLKNGLMDVPDDMLTRARQASSTTSSAREAEIIQFESDPEGRSPGVAGQSQTRSNAEPDSARLAELSSKLENVNKRLIEARAEIAQTADARNEDRASIEALTQQNEALEEKLRSAQRERDALEEKLIKSVEKSQSSLGKQQQLAGSLEKQQQEYDKRIRELETALEQVQGDYQQLGQRTSALGGERDAAVKDLEKTRKELLSLQEQLTSKDAENASRVGDLERKLAEAETALESSTTRERDIQAALQQEKDAGQALESQYRELQDAHREHDSRLQDLGKSAQQWQSEREQLVADLEARRQEVDGLTDRLQQAEQHEETLQGQLQEAARNAEETLLQLNADAIEAQEALNERIAELQARISVQDEQLAGKDSERDELERKLAEAEQQLDALSTGEQGAREQLQQAQKQVEEAMDHARQAGERADETLRQLAELQTQLGSSEQQREDLESRIEELKADHESDIASVRGALSRAQDENENVKREQIRLMDNLRAAEARLVDARNNHEAEIYRLNKELKASAGESNAGLAAELENVQAQLKESKRQREELEIQLGTRSEQLETFRAELENVTRRFEQAQESARQAEQQLVEANHAASEEMTVRLNAEQEIQQKLREERDKTAAERDERQNQVDLLTREAAELRAALELVQADVAEKEAAQQELLGLREELQRTEQEREQARAEQQRLQQEADQLRAEAEVTRGLMDMAPGGEGDQALREQLVESRRNVEVAVKLRSEAETRLEILQRQVERLTMELDDLRSTETVQLAAGEIPQLDRDDSDASAFLESVLNHHEPDQVSTFDDESETDASQVESASSFMAGVADKGDAESGPRRKNILAGLAVAGLLAAAATGWWLNRPAGSGMPPVLTSDVGLPGPEARVVAPEAPIAGAGEKALQSGAPDSSMPDEEVPGDDESVVPWKQALANLVATVEPESSPGATPETGVSEDEPVPAQSVSKQPAGHFQDRLNAGGQGPDMVELHADSYEMGSGSMSLNFDERPRHTVNLKRFAVSRHEITFEQYERFTAATGRSRPRDSGWGRGKQPVINVSWKDAVAYAEWLSEQTGHRYRLPTEAEWEFVARGGSFSRYWWGSDVGTGKANCFDCGSEHGGKSTAPVGTFEPNAYGVYDMAGNVREWVQDCHAANYNEAPGDGSAVESQGCASRVIRGGGFGSPSAKLRSTARDYSTADSRFDDLGFRVARDY